MNRKLIISYIVAFVVLGLGVFFKKKLSTKPQKEVVVITKNIPGVYADQVINKVTPISTSSNGSLVAKHKIDLFSEVQGIFESSDHLFKPGVSFKKGETLLRLNNDEFKANLQIQKSNLYQRLISILPDLKLDYPQQFPKWERYINAFDMKKRVSDLPSFANQKEKLFITGKGIPTAYYMVRNLEKRLVKFSIYAPFSGVLTTTGVNKGSLISPGQRIGSFINPSIYEVELDMSAASSKNVKIGDKILLHSLDHKQSWTGKVTRVNPVLNARSQSMTFYVQVSGKGLSEGMYLEADIVSKNNKSVYELNRSLIVNNNQVYTIVNDSILTAKDITIIHYGEKTALIQGVEDGTMILSQPLAGAFDGKIVRLVDGTR